MDVPEFMTIVADAILAHCPQYDRARVTTALASVFAGHPALLGGNSIAMLFGQNNDFTNATVTIGDVHAGHTINVHLPQPIDPALAALIARASVPATIHHGEHEKVGGMNRASEQQHTAVLISRMVEISKPKAPTASVVIP